MILDISKLEAPIHFDLLFGRKAPVEIEIGVGKGRFLREKASAHPEINFFGIEKSRKWLVHAARRMEKLELGNVRLLQCYLEGFLERYVPDESIAKYHFYFPDPWPKKRHHRRRLFTPPFFHQLDRTLLPKGEIHIATDHAEYYGVIMDTFTTLPASNLRLISTKQPGPFLSNFQVKYEKEGRSFSYAVIEKTDLSISKTYSQPLR